MSILGTRVVRTEDPRLLTAGGTYVDDLRLPELSGAARVTFVRSPVAHALITGIDASAARAAPGVVAVLTANADDLPPGSSEPMTEPLLATDRVRGAQFRAVVTNTTPISAYRGAGRPEAAAAIERAVDLFAAEIGMDPAEVRRRNAVPPEAFPYATATGAVYDTGAYAEALDTVRLLAR